MPTLYQANLSPFAARIRIQLRAKGIDGFDFVLPRRLVAMNTKRSTRPGKSRFSILVTLASLNLP